MISNIFPKYECIHCSWKKMLFYNLVQMIHTDFMIVTASEKSERKKKEQGAKKTDYICDTLFYSLNVPRNKYK